MSIVQELQRDAINSNVLTSELLRKALVVSRKLKLAEFQCWVESELNGYAKETALPDYRSIRGHLKYWNRFHGWVPINLMDIKTLEFFCIRPVYQSLRELETLVENSEGNYLSIPYPPAMFENMQGSSDLMLLQIELHTPINQIEAIRDTVRNTILDWSLKLEEDGIIGEGLSFSQKEKEIAHSHNYTIGTVGTVIGEMKNSQIQQDTVNSTQTQNNVGTSIEEVAKLMRELNDWLPTSSLDEETKEEIQADLATVQSQTESPKPKAKIISFALSSIQSALEKAAATALAAQLPDMAHVQHWADQIALAVQNFPIAP